jgi:hypothetical protein
VVATYRPQRIGHVDPLCPSPCSHDSKSKVISLVANIHASARAICAEYNGCVLVAF